MALEIPAAADQGRGLPVAWSTSQLAELAGTTLKTVRHYHQIGLLEEPERAPNGYKMYGVQHLVRLLRIRRMVDLGLPLSDVRAVDADGGAEKVLRDLDAELAASISRQQRMRRELATLLSNQTSIGLPRVFANFADDLSHAQRDLLLAYSSILTPAAMDALREQLAAPPSEVAARFEELPAHAPEEVRQELAEHLAPVILQQQRDHPFLADLVASSRHGIEISRSVVIQVLLTFYNQAQLDVLRRANEVLLRSDGS